VACEATESGDLVQAVVDRFDGDYRQVMAWICTGETLDDILLALQTSRLTGRPAEDILAASKKVGWQAVWKGYDLPPAVVAAATEIRLAPVAASAGEPDSTASAEESRVVIRLVTRSNQDAGPAAITWEGKSFVLVGRIAAVELENHALQVSVPTEGRRDVAYLVRLPADTAPSDLHAGWWVRIRGESGEGAYLLADEIEILHAVLAGLTPTPALPLQGSPAPTVIAGGWMIPFATQVPPTATPESSAVSSPAPTAAATTWSEPPQGEPQPPDNAGGDKAGIDKGKGKSEDKGKGKGKGEGKGKGKD
jgi:hypothetical protein